MAMHVTHRFAALAAWIGFIGIANAAPVAPVNAMNGIALQGYDPVAYFTMSAPAMGSEKYSTMHMGATWRFSSAEHLAAFQKSPDEYMPQFGGYCAWAVSQGYTAPVDPKSWKIVNGKLYLNYSAEVQKTWEKDIPGHIKAAQMNWPKLMALAKM